MRQFQIAIFLTGIISFIVAAVNWEWLTGLVFWRVGVALLLLDVVCIMLWPTRNTLATADESKN